jgi:hypothetical protein
MKLYINNAKQNAANSIKPLLLDALEQWLDLMKINIE